MKLQIVFIGALFAAASSLSAGTVSILYGDQDGFGIGATTFADPNVSNAGPGEAAFTDIRLIGDSSSFSGPAFAPTATLTFAPAGAITGVNIRMSLAEFGGNSDPVDGPNSIVVDGTTVPVGFLNSFASFANGANPNIDTETFALDSSFFPLFATGSIDLTGTHISERSGFGSFQVDYLAFDVTTADSSAPEPSTMLLGLSAGVGLLLSRRRRMQ